MEHRFNSRKEVHSPIIVFEKQIGFINASVKNSSVGGMLVDAGRLTLPKGRVVELAGEAAWRLESKTGLPKALIIHAKDGLMGLMLLASTKAADPPGSYTSAIGARKPFRQ